MNKGDIVYIMGEVRVCVDTSGPNWDFRDLHGGFDYFGKNTPYIPITTEEEILENINQTAMKKYEDDMDIYYRLNGCEEL